MKILHIPILFLSIFLIECNNSTGQPEPKLYDSLECENNSGEYYALYLPDSNSKKVNYPVLFLFDPGAHALKAVNNYKDLASKYKIILACSWSIKNGPVNPNVNAANSMIADVFSRFPVDESKVFYAGFSGGSRFAYYYAQGIKPAKGLIGCGAFFPAGNTPSQKQNFTYSCITGTADFNYREGIAMYNQMIEKNSLFQFIVFDGEHEWPPDSIFERALAYQFFSLDKSEINKENFIRLENKALSERKNSNDMIHASFVMQNLKPFNPYAAKNLEELYQSKLFNRQLKEYKHSFGYEDSLKKIITEAARCILLEPYNPNNICESTGWWNSKINTIKKVEDSNKNIYLKYAAQRAISDIGIILWQVNRDSFKQKNYKESLKAAEILCLAKPENETYLALRAESLYAAGKTVEAEKAYTEALDAGFKPDNEFLGTSIIIKKLNNLQNN